MIKAVIIEDETIHLEHLKQQLKATCPEITVVAEFSSAQKAIDNIATYSFDLLFLDVELGNTTAFELLQKISCPHNYHIIFISAYSQYAVRAFKVNATDYLLKPIDGNELRLAVNKAMKQIFTNETRNNLLSDYYFNKDQNLVITEKQSFVFLPVNDVIYCESDGNYTHVFYSECNKLQRSGDSSEQLPQLTVSKSISYLENELASKGFFRIHQKFLVNLKKIRKIDRHKSIVSLDGNVNLPVSRNHWNDLKKQLTN